MSRLRIVICFQMPISPAQTSGGVLGVWRTTALVFPSRENDAPGDAVVPINSSPIQIVLKFPPVAFTAANPDFPSMYSANVMRSFAVQNTQEGDDGIPGVMLCALPPETGTTKMSPPVEPSSLMRPSMKATFLPSGETRGSAICNFGA